MENNYLDKLSLTNILYPYPDKIFLSHCNTGNTRIF